MKWNVFLVVLSVLLLVIFVGANLAAHMMEAEAIAEQLGPKIDIPDDVIRSNLIPILRRLNIRRTLVNCGPLAVITVLLVTRLAIDLVREKNRGSM